MPKRSPGSRTPDDINKRFGARLRLTREMAGRSQTEVGQALGVSFQQVQKYENGTTSISLDRLDELARFFTLPVQNLIGGLAAPLPLEAGAGFSEGDQARFDDEEDEPKVSGVGPLSKEAVSLVKAFNRIPNRKLRRSIVAIVEGYTVDASDEPSDESD